MLRSIAECFDSFRSIAKTLRRLADHCGAFAMHFVKHSGALRRIANCCGALRSIAEHCEASEIVTTYNFDALRSHCKALRRIATHREELQCRYCGALPSIADHFGTLRTLRSVAARCEFLLRVGRVAEHLRSRVHLCSEQYWRLRLLSDSTWLRTTFVWRFTAVLPHAPLLIARKDAFLVGFTGFFFFNL